jgi:hypothetical protein
MTDRPERIDRFLQHALLVAHDDVRRAKLEELLQAVVAIDDAAIEIVQIRGRKPASVQWNEGTKLGRNDWDDVEDHPVGMMTGLAEGIDDLEALGGLELFDLRRLGAHHETQLVAELFDVDAAQQLFDGFGAHLGHEDVAVLPAKFAIALFGKQLFLVEDVRQVARVDRHVRLEVEDALEVP